MLQRHALHGECVGFGDNHCFGFRREHWFEDGADVVQLYVTDVLASVDVPNKQLKAFEKVMIPAGQTVKVDIELKVSNLGLWNQKMEYVVEPGDFVVYLGSSSADISQNATLTVV